MPERATSPISSLPNELILSIFCSLPSFSDVAYFAATCRLYRILWINQAFSIFTNVGPRTIPCRKFARTLLADQGGPSVTANRLALQDVLQLIRNAKVVELNIAQFNAQWMPALKVFHMSRAPKPKALSANERHRFARGIYQLWSFFIVDRATRQRRLGTLKLKYLLVISELLTFYFWHFEEDPKRRAILIDDGNPYDEVFADCYMTLAEALREHHGDESGSWQLTESDGIGGRFSLWDPYQGLLKEMVLFGASRDRNRKSPPLPSPQSVWDDTSDDDRAEGVEPSVSRHTT
ncbi:uncharacterized protein LDX57_011558 [Aspergillus melleus]|uniref:uncharacterized protein n=1 Tax=Aspergillus melleus TaxID=138277 RepID=UPI001E8D4C9B|nr:uncharacterized protein LDX57_011558 [Aspergillus melleus]KAH8433922.1 hypothetical protein LDX57_011558 [Aspergillus melleus]